MKRSSLPSSVTRATRRRLTTISVDELINEDSRGFPAHRGHIYRHWYTPDERGEELYQHTRNQQREVYGSLYDRSDE